MTPLLSPAPIRLTQRLQATTLHAAQAEAASVERAAVELLQGVRVSEPFLERGTFYVTLEAA